MLRKKVHEGREPRRRSPGRRSVSIGNCETIIARTNARGKRGRTVDVRSSLHGPLDRLEADLLLSRSFVAHDRFVKSCCAVAIAVVDRCDWVLGGVEEEGRPAEVVAEGRAAERVLQGRVASDVGAFDCDALGDEVLERVEVGFADGLLSNELAVRADLEERSAPAPQL